MPDLAPFTCKIHLTNGESISFCVQADKERQRNIGAHLEKSMNGKFMAYELEGTLNVIPLHSILRIEIEPAPHVLISNTIKDVRPL